MSDYAWFAIKGIAMLALIGFACWLTTSAVPLWALILMPSWAVDDSKPEAGNLYDHLDAIKKGMQKSFPGGKQ